MLHNSTLQNNILAKGDAITKLSAERKKTNILWNTTGRLTRNYCMQKKDSVTGAWSQAFDLQSNFTFVYNKKIQGQ